MGNPNKDSDGAMAMGDLTNPRDAHQAARDLSQEREARDTALAKQVAEAVQGRWPRLMRTTKPYLMRSAAVIPTSLKVTSRASGFKVIDPFDWTKDKAIYQR